LPGYGPHTLCGYRDHGSKSLENLAYGFSLGWIFSNAESPVRAADEALEIAKAELGEKRGL